MRYQTVSVLIAGVPGLTISVPYDKDEPIDLTLDRVTHKLVDTAYGDPRNSTRRLYIDGIRIEDYTKSVRHYGLFGKTITYKSSNIGRSVTLTAGASVQTPRKRSAKTLQVRVVSEGGESVTLAMAEGDTLDNLKTEISRHWRLTTSCQHLFFDGKRLEENKTLPDYDISSNATIYLLVHRHSSANLSNVFVKLLNGKTIICHIAMSQTLEELKRHIQLKENIAPAQQCLVFKRKNLEEDSWQLARYGIENDDMLHLTARLRGGSVTPTLFADVSDESVRMQKKFSPDAPPGRQVCYGTNIEVKCKCTKYQVISCQYFGLYELNETPTACPNCDSVDVTPATVGFYNCQYRIYGVKSNGERYKSEWIIVHKDEQYQVYDDAKQVAWRRLGIDSRPLDASTVDPCTICLDDINGVSTTLSCGHQFHKSCISSWRMTCPNCRSPQL